MLEYDPLILNAALLIFNSLSHLQFIAETYCGGNGAEWWLGTSPTLVSAVLSVTGAITEMSKSARE